MAKRRAKTAAQKEYNRELRLAKQRLLHAQKVLHQTYEIIPKKSGESYAQATARLQKLRQSEFTEEQIQQHREQYRYQYEQNGISIPESQLPDFTSPTENDFYIGSDNDFSSNSWEETPNEPVDSRQEINASIDAIISSIVDQTPGDKPNPEVKEILLSMVNDLRNQLGDDDFFEYMTDYGVVDQLQTIAREALAKYPTRKNPDVMSYAGFEIEKFATILNRGVPLTRSQSESLTEKIETVGTFGSLNFDAFEDLI